MSAITAALPLLLLLVPAAPLLMAQPTLRRGLRWPVQLALLPAIVLLFIPGSLSIELPWVLLGDSGLAFDGLSRWWLAMSIVAWGAASVLLYSSDNAKHGDETQRSWLLLSMAAQLAAVLAADLFSFFAFSSLMGYAFYGLLAFSANAQLHRAGRVYLVFLVIADLILFESILIVGRSLDDFAFARLAGDSVLSPEASLSLLLAFFGFALRAAIWPLHLWLPGAIAWSRPAIGLCIWIAPVATGLLGMLRWMSLAEVASPRVAVLLLVSGAVAIAYAMIRGLSPQRRQQATAHIIIAASGVVMLALGTALADAGLWQRYAGILPVFIVGVGIGLTLLTIIRAWLERSNRHSAPETAPVICVPNWYERWAQTFIRKLRHLGLVSLPALRTSTLNCRDKLWQREKWWGRLDAGEQYFSVWAFAILLAVILSILLVIVGLYSHSA